MVWSFKTKRGITLVCKNWETPIVWMRGFRTRHYFIGIIKAEDGNYLATKEKQS